MLLFYVPLAFVVTDLNQVLPLKGGLYQWAKEAFGAFWGFLIAWNLWVYAVIVLGSILFRCRSHGPRLFHRAERSLASR